MNKLLAALFAATFALSSGAALAQAQDKQTGSKKEEPKKEATTTKETKPKKGGC